MIALLAIFAIGIWSFVVYKAVRSKADITTLGLFLIVLGLAASSAFSALDVDAPGLLGYTISGVLLLILWRHR